jgi:WD40 repeat protein
VQAPASPYKGLAPFGDSDVDVLFFFGRDHEREVIVANMLASPLTVLYGPSGVGKSSLLRAGVVPRLREEEADVLYWASWAGSGAESLSDALNSTGERFVILDQLEEYFLYHRNDAALADVIADALGVRRATFLLALREDALAQLDAFKPRIPNLFANFLRLDRLNRNAARTAIERPLERYNELTPGTNVAAEPGFVDAVLDQVEAGKVDLGDGGVGAAAEVHGIEAPYLQLVLQRVWEEERAAGSHTLRLETLRRLGGAEQIVREHLERALDALSPEQKDVAAALFRHLVTPSGTKVAHRLSDLAGYADVEEADLAPVVSALGRDRILRPVGGDGTGGRYEIYHDVLGEAVLAWRTRRDLERQRELAEDRRRRAVAVAIAAVVALAIVAAVAVFALVERSHSKAAARHARGRAYAAESLVQLDVDAPRSLRLALRAARDAPSPATEDVLRSALADDFLRGAFGDVRDPATSIAFDPSAPTLAVGRERGTVELVDARTRKIVATLPHGGTVSSVMYSNDGRTLLSAGGDRVRLWDVAARAPVITFRAEAPIGAAAVAPTGRAVAAAAHRRVWLWRPHARRVLPQPRPILRLVFSPDGRTLLVLVRERRARLYDVRSGRLLRVISHNEFVFAGAFAPHAPIVATGSNDGEIRLTPLRRGRAVVIPDRWKSISDLAFSRDGALLAVGSGDGTARVYDVRTKTRLGVIVGHMRQVVSVAFSPDSKYVVTGSYDRTAKIWSAGDEDTGRLVASLTGSPDAVTKAMFSADGRSVATLGPDGRARLWDAAVENQLQPFASLRGAVSGAVTSQDGRLVLAWGDAGARVWNADRRSSRWVARGRVTLAALAPDGRTAFVAQGRAASLRRVADGHSVRTFEFAAPIKAVAWSPDGRRVAIANENAASLVSRHGGRRVDLEHRSGVTAVAFSPDGGRVATGTARGVVALWGRGRRPLYVLRGHRGAVVSVRFSPDGRSLVSASADATARIWGVDGSRRGALVGHTKPLTSARFSPDGREIVTAGEDAEARIWSVATRRTLHTLRGAFHTVSDASFSDDGRWILGAGPRTALLWNARTGERFAYLRGPTGPVTSAVWAPRSHVVVVASRDGTVRRYPCDVCGRLPQLVELGRKRLAATR